MGDITILIQGPLSLVSINKLHYYKEYPIILSHWKSDVLSLLQHALPHSTVATDIAKADKYAKYIGGAHAHYQVVSTLEGLKACKTEFVIKVRSDEFYSNLKPVEQLIHKNPNKIITSNVFIQSFRENPFKISDHLIACKTHTFTKALKFLLAQYDTGHPEEWTIQKRGTSIEAILGQALIEAKGIKTDAPMFEIVKHFEVIDVNQLGPYLQVANHQGEVWDSKLRPYINPIKEGKDLW